MGVDDKIAEDLDSILAETVSSLKEANSDQNKIAMIIAQNEDIIIEKLIAVEDQNDYEKAKSDF